MIYFFLAGNLVVVDTAPKQLEIQLAPTLTLRDGIVVETLAEPVRTLNLVCHNPFSFRVQRYGNFFATKLQSYEPLSEPRLGLLDSYNNRIVTPSWQSEDFLMHFVIVLS